jgi:hypothetical protein
MAARDRHGRRRPGGPGQLLPSARGRAPAVAAGVLTALAAIGTGLALAAAPGAPVVATEKAGDAGAGAPDLKRVSLQRGDDGRLRAGLTFAQDLPETALVAKAGPPGSVCLRLFTAATPGILPPDYLVCVTADAKGRALRGSVLAEQVNRLPRRVGTAVVSRPSRRSIVLRFSQSVVGRPPVIQFAAEATRAGCVRAGCVDTLPDAPETKKLILRLEAPPER